MKKNLENDLHLLYNDVPIPDSNNIQDTIVKVRQIVSETQHNDLTFWQFYFQQFGFIRKKVWLIQFIILLFSTFKLYQSESTQVINLISSIAPLIFLSGITELSRTHTYGTMEIELSTQYTLKEILMSRISILGLINILSISILSIIVRTNTSLPLYTAFIYICVPFMLTSFGSLYLLNKFKNKECNYYCFILGIFIMLSTSIWSAYFPNLYTASSLFIWNILLIISIIGVSMQIHKLLNSCNKKYDYMNLTNI